MGSEGDAAASGKKKRKNSVVTDLGVETLESDVQVAHEDHSRKKKKKKSEVSSDMSEGVLDLNTSGEMNERSKKKKKKDRSETVVNSQEDDDGEGEIKKDKKRDKKGSSSAVKVLGDEVSEESLDHQKMNGVAEDDAGIADGIGVEKGGAEKKKKKKKKTESNSEKKPTDDVSDANTAEKHFPNEITETDQRVKIKKQKKVKEDFVDASSITELSGNNGEDDRLGGDNGNEHMITKKKKKEKKIRAEKCKDNEVAGASKSVGILKTMDINGNSSTDLVDDRISDEVPKEKKRKKKKDASVASSSDEQSGITTHAASVGESEERKGKGSKKRKEKSLGVNKDATNVDMLENNKSNEAGEPSENLEGSKKSKKVKFSENVEVFPLHDSSSKGKKKQPKDGSKGKKKQPKDESKGKKKQPKDKSKDKTTAGDGLIRGKRFSKEEDEIVRAAVLKYIEDHQLGENGVEMVMKCRFHPEIRDCWKEIGEAVPYRPYEAVYYRAHILFERSDTRKWTPEDLQLVKEFYEKHGPDWRKLSDELGRHRFHVKDAWRRIRFTNHKYGNWSQEEYQQLFDLVNLDLSMKVFSEKKTKHGMLRDNISWEAISDKLSTRSNSICCMKWYRSLMSPMVAEKKWANTDDYRLLIALSDLDASCEEDVDWDNLLEHRSGDVCRKRWNQMVRHIGEYGTKSFSEQVDVLSQRYCPDILEAREDYDNKTPVD